MEKVTRLYYVGFKKRGPGRVKWVVVEAVDKKQATTLSRDLIARDYPAKRYLLFAGPLEK